MYKRLEDLAQPTEEDLKRIRNHPAYMGAFNKLRNAGKEYASATMVLPNSDEHIKVARDTVASEIKRRLQPLHDITHVGKQIENDINDKYLAETQALRDWGYDPFSEDEHGMLKESAYKDNKRTSRINNKLMVAMMVGVIPAILLSGHSPYKPDNRYK